MLRLDLGVNMWVLGVCDNNILKMVNIKIIEPGTVSILKQRKDAMQSTRDFHRSLLGDRTLKKVHESLKASQRKKQTDEDD